VKYLLLCLALLPTGCGALDQQQTVERGLHTITETLPDSASGQAILGVLGAILVGIGMVLISLSLLLPFNGGQRLLIGGALVLSGIACMIIAALVAWSTSSPVLLVLAAVGMAAAFAIIAGYIKSHRRPRDANTS
jgi:CHASE2 domain-containing sensor protein